MATSLVRRAAARAVLAGGVAVLAMLAVRDCESRARDIEIIVDPRPLGDTVRAIRVDVFDRSGGRGSIEPRYQPGDVRAPVRLRSAPPGRGGELHVEVDTDDGLRRVRRPLEVAAGSKVRLTLGVGPDGPALTP
jgi:hypothetical protein